MRIVLRECGTQFAHSCLQHDFLTILIREARLLHKTVIACFVILKNSSSNFISVWNQYRHSKLKEGLWSLHDFSPSILTYISRNQGFYSLFQWPIVKKVDFCTNGEGKLLEGDFWSDIVSDQFCQYNMSFTSQLKSTVNREKWLLKTEDWNIFW